MRGERAVFLSGLRSAGSLGLRVLRCVWPVYQHTVRGPCARAVYSPTPMRKVRAGDEAQRVWGVVV